MLCCCVKERKYFPQGGPQYSDTISLSHASGWNGSRANQIFAQWKCVQHGTKLRTVQGKEDDGYLMRCHLQSASHISGDQKEKVKFTRHSVSCHPWPLPMKDLSWEDGCSLSAKRVFRHHPTDSVLNPRVPSNLDWRWTLASKCSGPAAHCSGSHGKSQGDWPDCSRNITNDVTANSECLFPVSGWLINSPRSGPKRHNQYTVYSVTL